jgi:hypothetical protein
MNHAAERAHSVGTEKVHGDGERDNDTNSECEKGFACEHVRSVARPG